MNVVDSIIHVTRKRFIVIRKLVILVGLSGIGIYKLFVSEFLKLESRLSANSIQRSSNEFLFSVVSLMKHAVCMHT